MEFCVAIPNCLKTAERTDKWIIRHAMKERLPSSIIGAKKAPFHAPHRWHTERAGIESVLGARAVAEVGLVDSRRVQDLRRLAESSGDRAAEEKVFSLYVLHLWFR